jgi:hypothetical protein
VFVRENGKLIDLRKPETMADEKCDCLGRGVVNILLHRKGDTIFLCEDCFEISGHLESLTIGRFEQKRCAGCGTVKAPFDGGAFIVADADFNVQKICSCVHDFLKKPGNGHIAFAFLKMNGQVR